MRSRANLRIGQLGFDFENNEQHKICHECGKSKPLSQFHKLKYGVFGRNGDCGECYNRKRNATGDKMAWYYKKTSEDPNYNAIASKRYTSRHPERISARKKVYYTKNKERITARMRVRYAENKEVLNEKSRTYYKNNKERLTAYRADWVANHLDQVRLTVRLREYRVKGAAGQHTRHEWNLVLDYYNNQCLCCGIKGELTKQGRLSVDHCIPITRNGNNYITNLAPLCHSCNSAKGNKLIDYRLDENRHPSVVINHSIVLPWMQSDTPAPCS